MNVDQVVEFASQRNANEYLYLVLDPLADCDPEHPLSISMLCQALGSEAIELISRPDLTQLPTEWPALVQLAAPGQVTTGHLSLSVAQAMAEITFDKRYICGWLVSEQPPAIVAKHLAEQGRALKPTVGQAIAPWFEPARLELLAAAMDNVSGLLWPIRAWFYPTLHGDLQQIVGKAFIGEVQIPDLARDVQSMAPQVSRLLGAWRDLNADRQGSACLRWQGRSGLPPIAPIHAFRLIWEAWQRGLRESEDIHCLCLHLVMIHPLLLSHPTIQQDVAQAAEGKQSLVSRFITYNDTTWKQLAMSLPMARSHS
ncbi:MULTISPECIES: hypothetical protein [Pseudomonas]|uniref:hypothetical protein n=1 Tax=Pseudomonas TaxID=286 RepID=UPI0018AB3992|nr:hypothetical protein [Pseudomonas guariconensis]MBF8720369.1 hypothetical protein [Pseudomonas guariconensis]